MERMHKIEEEHQEREKQREREELKKDPDATIKAYRATHFICSPRCGFVCDRRDEGAIIQHKSQCGYCIEAREEKEKELEFKHEGFSKMRYVVGMLQKCEEDIKVQERKIDRETR